MVNPLHEKIVLGEHSVSLISLFFSYYFNDNSNIKCLALVDMLQHIIKIVRILCFGFQLDYGKTPYIFCIIHSFINDFTRNGVVTFSCFIIISLYIAYKRPIAFARNHRKYRGYLYFFIVLYIASFILISLNEAIFFKYTEDEMRARNNCFAGYRYKLYQYILISPIPNIVFIVPAMVCSVSLFFRIKKTPDALASQISNKDNISFSKWIKILIITSILCILSIVYLFTNIPVATNAGKNKKETEEIDVLYFINASSGVLIMIFTVSLSQIKNKLRRKDDSRAAISYNYSSNGSLKDSKRSISSHIDSVSSEREIPGISNKRDGSIKNNMRMNPVIMPTIQEDEVNNVASPMMNSPSMVYFKNILNNKNDKPIAAKNSIIIKDIEIIDTSPSVDINVVPNNTNAQTFTNTNVNNDITYVNNTINRNNNAFVNNAKSIFSNNTINDNSPFYNNMNNESSISIDTSREASNVGSDDYRYLLSSNNSKADLINK